MIPIVRDVIDFFFPRYCCMCDSRLAITEKYFCVGCLRELNRIAYEGGEEHGTIERLFWGKIPIERATSMFHYEGEKTRRILHDIKYFDQPEIAVLLAQTFVQEMQGKDFFDGIDIIVPVPLSRRKNRKRGYNQCDYISEGLSSKTGIPVVKDAVIRVIDNPTQTHLSPQERMENVKDIFQLAKPEKLKDCHLLIVDDVITTGSTILSLAEEVAKVENVRISIFSLAFAGEMKTTNLP